MDLEYFKYKIKIKKAFNRSASANMFLSVATITETY